MQFEFYMPYIEQKEMSTDLAKFSNIVRNKVQGSNRVEREFLQSIPDENFSDIFVQNFNSDLDLARKIISDDFNLNNKDLDGVIASIPHKDDAIAMLVDCISNSKRIFIVVDCDNDGTLSKAIGDLFKSVLEEYGNLITVDYRDENHKSRTITLDLISEWANENKIDENEQFLVVTADQGSSAKPQQIEILDKYPNTKFLMTDHHIPCEIDRSLEITNKAILFNPKAHTPPCHKYFKNNNISGAHVFGVLVVEALRQLVNEKTINLNSEELSVVSNDILTLCYVANNLDFVKTDVRFKPLSIKTIKKANQLGPVANVSNAVNKYIYTEYTEQDYEKLSTFLGEDNTKIIKKTINKIKSMNLIAGCIHDTIIHYQDAHLAEVTTKAEDDVLERILANEGFEQSYSRRNHISRLRPYLYQYSFKSTTTDYEQDLKNLIFNHLQEAKKLESVLLDSLRENEVIDIFNHEESVIVTTKDEIIDKFFNRTLIRKAYNFDLRDFTLYLGCKGARTCGGSFRSSIPITSLLKHTNHLKSRLGIEIIWKGHTQAAGFEIIKTDSGTIDSNTIDSIAKFIKNRVSKTKPQQVDNTLICSLDALNLIEQINAVCRAGNSMSASISPLLRLPKNLYFTQSDEEILSINKLAQTKNFGYHTISTHLSRSEAMVSIVPAVTLKRLAERNFGGFVRSSYIDNGVFMICGLADKPKKSVPVLETQKNHFNEHSDYYKSTYENADYTVNLSREQLMDNPVFTTQSNPITAFERYEAVMIKLIQQLNLDEYITCDTEANGFGKSPNLFNLGTVNVKINHEINNITLCEKFFKDHLLMNRLGEIYLHSIDEILALPANKTVLVDDYINTISTAQTFVTYYGDIITIDDTQLLRVANYCIDTNCDTGTVIINQQIHGSITNFFINNNYIGHDFATFTNINNTMLKRHGLKAHTVQDKYLNKYEKKRTITAAHNAGYDTNVLYANLPKLMEELFSNPNHILLDTKDYAKAHSLAFDNCKYIVFNKLNAAFPWLTETDNVVYWILQGKVGRYASSNPCIFLERNEYGTVTITNNSHTVDDDNRTTIINLELEELSSDYNSVIDMLDGFYPDSEIIPANKTFKICEMPKNIRKYSVQKIFERNCVYGMLTNDLPLINYPKQSIINEIMSGCPEDIINLGHYLAMFYSFSSPLNKQLVAMAQHHPAQNIGDYLEYFKRLEKWIHENNPDYVFAFFNQSAAIIIIEHFEPDNLLEITEELIEHLSQDLGIQADTVRKVLIKCVLYKNKKFIPKVLRDEAHNNTIIKTPEGSDLTEADTVLEGPLMTHLLIDKLRQNTFEWCEKICDEIIYWLCDSSTKLMKVECSEIALDSLSARQAQSRKRTHQATSRYTKDMRSSDDKTIRFKGLLPEKSCLRLSPKADFDLDSFIDEAGFIINYRILEQALNNRKFKGSPLYDQVADLINDLNETLCTKIKRTSEMVEWAYFSRSQTAFSNLTNDISCVFLNKTHPQRKNGYQLLTEKQKESIAQYSERLTNSFQTLVPDFIEKEFVDDTLDNLDDGDAINTLKNESMALNSIDYKKSNIAKHLLSQGIAILEHHISNRMDS
ncbi:single-stranded-DNA-specific exonuclease RecJ family protein [Photobacterium leiognathi]|uniref:hypothetical protein n=1 Tax=Photobacterium leiognathi TaxID=553611 RepID=UPI002982B235|nr:hypothetical protein [Photobacterium leiognathi]